MNPWDSKHVEDIKNQIKALIWKVCISLVYVAWLYHNASARNIKNLHNPSTPNY